MKILSLLLLAATCVTAQTAETPLTTLPYTPGLDQKFMDKTADPCQDFFRYACGSWIKINPIPADQALWNVYAKLTDENARYLWGILERLSHEQASPASAPEREVGAFYAACMDEPGIEKAGLAALVPDLRRLADIKSVKEIAAILGKEHLTFAGAGDMMFGYGSNQDFANSNEVISFLGAGGLGLPDRDYYTKTDKK